MFQLLSNTWHSACQPDMSKLSIALTTLCCAPPVSPTVYQLPPLPKTRRGYGIQLYCHPRDPLLIYANSKNVVIRSVVDLSHSVIFSEHKADVNVARFSPNGNYVASGDAEGNVIIWSYPSLKVKSQFTINKSVLDLDWDADGQRLVAAGEGATTKVKVFTWDSGNNLGEIGHIHTQQVLSVSYRKHRPYRIVSASEDLTVNHYEGPPFKYNGTTYKGHQRYPNAVRFSPNGELYASVGADSKIVVYDGKSGEVKAELADKADGKHTGAIVAFDWSPDSTEIITASLDKTCKIWSVTGSTLSVVTTFSFGSTINDQQVGCCWLPNNTIVTVSLSGAINIVDRDNPKQAKYSISGHQSSLQALTLSPDHQHLYTSSLDGDICEWDLQTGVARWLPISHSQKIISRIAISSDGKSVLTAGMDEKLRITPQQGGSEAVEIPIQGQPTALLASSKDASLAFVTTSKQQLYTLHGGDIHATSQLPYTATTLALTHTETQLLVADKERKPRIHIYSLEDLRQLQEVGTLEEHDKAINDIAVSSDGKLIATVDSESSVYVRDAADATQYPILNKSGWRFHEAAVQSASFSPDQQLLATGSTDFGIILWTDLQTLKGADRVRIERAHPYGVIYVQWLDNDRLLSAGADRVIRMWQVRGTAAKAA